MNHKEKLIEIINNVIRCDKCGIVPEWLAEDLIFYGVTVQEWISVKDRLPELTEGTECYKQSPCCLVTLQWWDGEMSESIGWYNQSGEWNEDSKNCKVIAWQPLPKAYQPKGE